MIRDVVIGYWPFWLLVSALVFAALDTWAGHCADRRTDRARQSLTEAQARAAVRPSPAPVDVERMR